MKVTILGSGSFFIDKNHSAPGYLIQNNGKNILLDCGPGTLVQLAKINFDPLDIDYIFLTHFHNDHTSDLVALLFRPYILETYYGGTFNKTLNVVGPKGVKEFVVELANIFHHENVPNFNKLKYLDYEQALEFEDFKVETFKVDHLGLDAYALRFIFGEKIFTYSGDSTLCDGVIAAAKDADLFITDAATPKDKPATAHLGTTQVGEICRDNNVKKVILSHQVPPGYNVDMAGQVKEVFDGDVQLAKDLMRVEL